MIVIQARSTSKRLPRKSMREINGYPLIHWVLSSCLAANDLHNIILAIPKGNSERELRRYVRGHFPKVTIMQGDESNVFSRFKTVLTLLRNVFENEPDGLGFVRVCADRPLLMPKLLLNLRHSDDNTPELLFNHNTETRNGPNGIGAESLSKALALEFFFGDRNDWIDEEHVTSRIYNLEPSVCKSEKSLNSEKFHRRINYSVDTAQDFNVINEIVKEFSIKPGTDLSIETFCELERYLCVD